MRKSMSARLAILAGAATALALGGAAFAYSTTSGSGNGTATVGDRLPTVTVTGSVSGELLPDGAPTTVKVTVRNTGAHAAHVQAASLTNITVDAGHSSCETSTTAGTPAFTMTPVSIGKTLAGGEEITATGSLQMNGTGVSDACQGAGLTLHFASS